MARRRGRAKGGRAFDYRPELQRWESGAAGNLVHDAHIAALCLEHGVREIVTGDTDVRLFHAPGVEFPATEEGVQPDLVFVSTERRGIIAEDWLRGAPDLVVEILSPSTEDRDRGVKRNLYRRQGVGEYWLVDPDDGAVEVWRFGASHPEGGATHHRFTDRLPVRTGDEVVGEIDPGRVFS